MAFLRGLRLYGRGNWKKIATLIPTRGTVQTKTHAQTLMKKYAEGENIFRELELFERGILSENEHEDDDDDDEEDNDIAGLLLVVGKNTNKGLPSLDDDGGAHDNRDKQQYNKATNNALCDPSTLTSNDIFSAKILMMLRSDKTVHFAA